MMKHSWIVQNSNEWLGYLIIHYSCGCMCSHAVATQLQIGKLTATALTATLMLNLIAIHGPLKEP